jgi:hypothetical protein
MIELNDEVMREAKKYNTPDINPIWWGYTRLKHCQRPDKTLNFSKASFVGGTSMTTG